MKRSKVRIRAFAAAMLMIVATVMTPIEAFADTEDYERYEEALNIDTSQVDVKDTWRQIRNAALFQLVTQKLYMCIAGKSTKFPAMGGSSSSVLGGNYGFPNALTGYTVATGPWLQEQMTGKSSGLDGSISCGSKALEKLMDAFANIYTVYRNNAKATLSGSSAVGAPSRSDRLKVVCDPDEPTKAGLLIGTSKTGFLGLGTPTVANCNAAEQYSYGTVTVSEDYARNGTDQVSAKTLRYLYYNVLGAPGGTVTADAYQYQVAYLWRLYDEIKEFSGNPYMVDWADLGNYDGVKGYYLYSLDFKAQGCETNGRDFRTYVVSNDGEVELKSYAANAKVASSFVGGEKTCAVLGQKMNEHIEEYLKTVNFEVYDVCRKAIDEKILEKTTEINEKYINNGDATDEAKDLAQEVLDIYADVQKTGAYVAKMEEDGKTGTEVIKVKGENGAISDTVGNMPTDMVFTCRASLPFIGVNITPEINWEEGLSGFGSSDCKNSGAISSLGWIICPVMTWMMSSAGGLYGNFVEPALQIEPQLFKEQSGENNDTHDAWRFFQGIANVLFVILFLAVIFSQLTGVGIDNYGIKRILPKLIVAAILVNFSYYICVICVDLSNIAGGGIKAMFEGLASGMTPTVSVEGQSLGSVTSAVMTAVPIAGLIFGAVAIWANPAIILSLLVSLLGLVISVFFLFLILAAREAAIVVLIVISPLAFACYTLPNTKKLFDRWVKMGEGLLLVYPICALLVAGGGYVSKLLLVVGGSDQGFFSAFAAMLVGIVPVFFIPTVLRSSFAAMGNLGAKIAGFGDRMRGGVDRRIRSSEGYKAAQKRGYERQTRIRAGIDSKGNVTGRGAFKARLANSWLGRRSGYQGLQAARVASAQKTREENIQSNAALADVVRQYGNKKNPTESNTDRFKKSLEKAKAAGNANEMFAVIEQMKAAGTKASDMAKITREVFADGQFGNMNAGQRRNFLEEFGKKYSNDFLKKDFEQADWARKGGIGYTNAADKAAGVNSQMMGLNGFMASNIEVDDLKDEDVANLSADRLYDLVNGGKISRSQAQRVWASNNNMDDTSRLIMGTYAVRGDKVTKQDAQKALQGTYAGSAAGLNASMVESYTRRAAEDIVVRDVDIRNTYDGSKEQTDDLAVHDDGVFTVTHPVNGKPQKPNRGPETFSGGGGI